MISTFQITRSVSVHENFFRPDLSKRERFHFENDVQLICNAKNSMNEPNSYFEGRFFTARLPGPPDEYLSKADPRRSIMSTDRI